MSDGTCQSHLLLKLGRIDNCWRFPESGSFDMVGVLQGKQQLCAALAGVVVKPLFEAFHRLAPRATEEYVQRLGAFNYGLHFPALNYAPVVRAKGT